MCSNTVYLRRHTSLEGFRAWARDDIFGIDVPTAVVLPLYRAFRSDDSGGGDWQVELPYGPTAGMQQLRLVTGAWGDNPADPPGTLEIFWPQVSTVSIPGVSWTRAFVSLAPGTPLSLYIYAVTSAEGLGLPVEVASLREVRDSYFTMFNNHRGRVRLDSANTTSGQRIAQYIGTMLGISRADMMGTFACAIATLIVPQA